MIARWDLDKTYLRSDFATLRDLFESVTERPDQKRSVPGAAQVLRELQRQGAYVHVLSGSPRQLGPRLRERLRMDGVAVDRFTLKPNLSNLLRLRLRALKAQLGYKLSSLLRAADEEAALGWSGHAEVLLGDDSEQDALVYSLFADVCLGMVSGDDLASLLERAELYPDETTLIATLAPRMAERREGARFTILIHLDRQTPPSRFAPYGPRVVPFFNYAQAALVLQSNGHLEADAVLRVAAHLLLEHRFDFESLNRSFLDLERRGVVTRSLLEPLQRAASEAPEPVRAWPRALGVFLDATPAELRATPIGGPPRVDYRALLGPAK